MTNPQRRENCIFRLRPAAASVAAGLAALFMLGIMGVQQVEGQTFSVLYAFTGTGGDGVGPSGDLIQDATGNLYGSTFGGGTSGLGTIFKLNPTGTETVLYSFVGGTQGGNPNPGLVRDAAGALYGTNAQDTGYISGTVFRVDATGTETILHTFGTGDDGQYPRSALIQDAKGNFYGTTSEGGRSGFGTIFKLDAFGTETVLYDFVGGTGGAYPIAGVIQDSAGNFYGTTLRGGNDISCDCGIAFKLDAKGAETVLHNFSTTDGNGLGYSLVRDAVGNLYGTTVYGGITSVYCKSGCGTVFKLGPTGFHTLLHNFTGKHDGKAPDTSLIRDAVGNLYGTTEEGGDFNLGAVFKIGPAGRETVLHSFTGGTDGATPYAGLMEDAAGNLYGAALNGGAFGAGTIFKITP